MRSLFPIKQSASADIDGVRLVDVADDRDSEALESLSSSTARKVLAAIRDDPKPASEIADEVDISIQNAKYHLENLTDAELVRSVDVWYSSTGTEMDVYAPTCEGLLVMTGAREQSLSLDGLGTIVGSVVVSLALASIALARFVGKSPLRYQGSVSVDPGTLAYLRPELVFFAGGTFSLLVVVAVVLLQRL